MLLERRRMQRAPPPPKRLLHQHENKQTPPHPGSQSPAWSLCMAAQKKKKWPFFIVLACLHSIVARRVQISSFYEPQGSHRPCVAAAAAWSTEAQPSSVLHRQHPPPQLPPSLTHPSPPTSPNAAAAAAAAFRLFMLPVVCLFVWLLWLIGDSFVRGP